MKQKYFWPKLIGIVLLLHVVLITLTFVEVFIYSWLIQPGRTETFYSNHAQVSGPWIGSIIGAVLVFFLTKRFVQRFTHHCLLYAVALPLLYILTDYLIFIAMGINIKNHLFQFLAGNSLKIIASAGAWFMYKKEFSK